MLFITTHVKHANQLGTKNANCTKNAIYGINLYRTVQNTLGPVQKRTAEIFPSVKIPYSITTFLGILITHWIFSLVCM